MAGKLQELTKGVIKNNPIFVLMLGLCPTLAVTTSVQNAFAMGLAVSAVLICSNVTIVDLQIEEKARKKVHAAHIHARIRDKDLTMESAAERVRPDIAAQVAGHF